MGAVCFVLCVACFTAQTFYTSSSLPSSSYRALSFISGIQFVVGVNGFILMILIVLCYDKSALIYVSPS